MRHLGFASRLAAAASAIAAAAALFAGTTGATAQERPADLTELPPVPTDYDPGKTSWGDPDITGAYAEFTTAPLERDPKYGDKEFFTPEEHAEFAKQRMSQQFSDDDTEPGTQADVHYSMGQFALSENEGVTSLNLRTSIVTQPKNGRIPALTPAAVARRDALAAARKGREFDGPETRSLTERCIVWTSTLAPILPRGYNSNLQIFQSPGHVIIQGEMGDPRVIPTDGRALPMDPNPAWFGYSIGRWEGDAFVVESSGFNDNVWLDNAGRPAGEALRVIERFRRTDFGHIDIDITIDDPKTYTRPWKVTFDSPSSDTDRSSRAR